MTFLIALATGAGMGGAAVLVFYVVRATGEGFVAFAKGWYLARRHMMPPQVQRKIDGDMGLPHDAQLPMPIMPAPVVFDLEAENRRIQGRYIWEKVFTETVVSVAGNNGGRASEDALLAAATTAHSALEVWEQFREYQRDRARQTFAAAPVAVHGGAL